MTTDTNGGMMTHSNMTMNVTKNSTMDVRTDDGMNDIQKHWFNTPHHGARHLRRLALLLLLLTAGAAAWAQTFHYIVLDKDGNEEFKCQNTGFGLPTDLKSPLVGQFFYWNDKTARESANQVSSVSDMTDGGTYYVTYTLNATGEAIFSCTTPFLLRWGNTYMQLRTRDNWFTGHANLMCKQYLNDTWVHDWSVSGTPYSLRLTLNYNNKVIAYTSAFAGGGLYEPTDASHPVRDFAVLGSQADGPYALLFNDHETEFPSSGDRKLVDRGGGTNLGDNLDNVGTLSTWETTVSNISSDSGKPFYLVRSYVNYHIVNEDSPTEDALVIEVSELAKGGSLATDFDTKYRSKATRLGTTLLSTFYDSNKAPITEKATDGEEDIYIRYQFTEEQKKALEDNYHIYFSNSYETVGKWMNLQNRGTTSANWLTGMDDSNNVNIQSADNISSRLTNFAFIGDPYHFSIVNQHRAEKGWGRYANVSKDTINSGWSVYLSTNTEKKYWALMPPVESGSGRFQIEYNKSVTLSTPFRWGWATGGPHVATFKALSASNDFIAQQAPEAVTVRYVVVNHAGEESIWYNSPTTSVAALSVPEYVKSPLAENYRIYASYQDAVSDDPSKAIDHVSAATVVDGKAFVYVRYDVAANSLMDSKPVAITLNNTRMARDVLSQNLKITGSELEMEPHSAFWLFEGTDPYGFDLRNYSDASKFIGLGDNSNGNNDLKVVDARESHYAIVKKNGGNDWCIIAVPAEGSCEADDTYDNTMTFSYLHDSTNIPQLAKKAFTALTGSGESVVVSAVGVVYQVIDNSGNLSVSAVTADTGTPSMPAVISSPLATRFTYYSDRACTATMSTIPSANCVVYVRYEQAKDAAVKLDGSVAYNIRNKDKAAYLKARANSDQDVVRGVESVTESDLKTSQFLWFFENDDPYNVTVRPVYNTSWDWRAQRNDAKHWMRAAVSTYGPNWSWDKFAVMSSSEGLYELMYTGRYTNTDYYYVAGYTDDQYIIQNGTSFQAGNNIVEFTLSAPFTVTYHVMASADTERVKATVKASPAAKPSVPDVIRSAQAVYSYYKDAALTQKYGDDEVIGTGTADIYVAYTYNTAAPIPLSATAKYKVRFNGSKYWHNDNNNLWANATATGNDAEFLVNSDNSDPYQVRIKCANNSRWLSSAAADGTADSYSVAPQSGSTYVFLHEGDDGKYELRYSSNAFDMGDEGFYYTMGSNGSDPASFLFYKSSTKPAGHSDLQAEFMPTTLTYHLVNLSGREALQYTPTELPATYAGGFPERFKSPLATNYRFYTASQLTTTVSDDQTVYSVKSGEADAGSTAADYGHVVVMYDYDAEAAATLRIDLSGTATHQLFGGADMMPFCTTPGKDEYLAKKSSYDGKPYIGTRHIWYDWTLNGTLTDGTTIDPYQVSIYQPGEEGYLYANTCNNGQSGDAYVVNLTWSDNDGWGNRKKYPYKKMMLLNGNEAGRFTIMPYHEDTPQSGDRYHYVYSNGTYLQAARQAAYQPGGSSEAALQFVLQRSYTYHVMNFSGEKAIDAVEERLVTPDMAPCLPRIVTSPLVSSYQYYRKEGEGYVPISHVADAADGNIYVFYKKADLRPLLLDLTGQTSYNIRLGDTTRYAYNSKSNNNETNQSAENPTSETLASDAYLWYFTGGDPYAVKIYNRSVAGKYLSSSYPADMAHRWDNDKDEKFKLSSQAWGTFMIVWGFPYGTERGDREFELMLADADPSRRFFGIADMNYFDRSYGRNGDHKISGQKYSTKMTITPAGNADHTYIVVNRQGREALRMTVKGAENAAPQVPAALRSPLATAYKCWSDQACTAAMTNTGTGPQTIYVSYTPVSNPPVNLNGEGYYFLKSNGRYAHADATATLLIADGTYDESKLAYYAWQFTADEGDPYNVVLRLAGVSGKALGTPDYTNSGRRRAAAKHHALLLYDDSDDHVMTFAILDGANQTSPGGDATRYALVVSGHDEVAAEGQVADITGNQYNYLGREDDNLPGQLLLVQGDISVSSDAVQIDRYDDPSQEVIEPMLLPYHFHIMAPEAGHAVIESYTCTGDDEVVAGMLARDAFPDALVRLGAPVAKMRFYATATELTDAAALANAYDEAGAGLQLGLDKLHVYVRYEVDEDELPFYYSDPTAELNAMEWYQWKGTLNSKWYYMKYQEDTGKVTATTGLETTNRDDLSTDAQLSADEYLFAFLGDPYRTRIINKAAGKDKFLSADNKEGYVKAYFTSDASTYPYNQWGLATRKGETTNYDSFRLLGTSANSIPSHLRAGAFRIDTNSGTPAKEFWQRIIPRTIHFTYNVINLSGKRAVRVKAKTTGALNTATDLNSLWQNDDYLKYARVGGEEAGTWSYYGPEAVSVSDGTYTIDATKNITAYTPTVATVAKNVNIYVKYSGSGKYRRKGDRIYTISKKDDATKYLYLDADGRLAATAEAPSGKYARRYLWLVKPTLVGKFYDPYDIRLYNLTAPTRPVSAGAINRDDADDNPVTIGSEADAQVFAMTGHATFGLMLTDSNEDDGPLFAFLRIDRAPRAEFRSEMRNGSEIIRSNHGDIALNLNEVKLTYHIYNLQGDKAIGRELTASGDIIAQLSGDDITVPAAIRSPLVKDGSWHFYSDEARTTPITTYDGVTSGNIYVTYDYRNDVDGEVDLSGEVAYNIHTAMYARQTYNDMSGQNAYWCYPGIIDGYNYVRIATLKDGATDTYVRSQYHNRSNPTHTLAGTDDAMLWYLKGNDPYAITLASMAEPTVALSRAGDNGNGYFQIKAGATPLKLILVESSCSEGRAAGDYEFIIAQGDNTIRRTWVYHENSPGYDHITTRDNIDDNFHRVHLTPRSADYHYNIVNLSSHLALVYTGKGVPGKTADKLPTAIESPLAQNFRFYTRDQFNVYVSGTTGVETYELKGDATPTAVFPAVDTDAGSPVPELYVLYDYKPLADMNLSAGRKYYLRAGADGRYAHKAEGSADTRLSDAPVKTRPTVSNYLWTLDAADDPYDLRLRNDADDNLALTAATLDEGGADATFAATGTVQQFCLLPGDGTTGRYSIVAASADAITDNRFAYLAAATGGNLQTLRADDLNHTTAAVQMLIEVPTFDYRYRIVSLDDHVAMQYTVRDGRAGDKPAVPTAISTPLADYTGYYLIGQYTTTATDYEAAATAYGLRANEQSLDVDGTGGLPYYDADIYVEYQYDEAQDALLNITGRKYYNLLSDGDARYARHDGGTIATDATAPSPLATDSYMWALDGTVTGGSSDGSVDPYHLTLTTHEGGGALQQGTYVALPAAGGRWVLAATGTATTAPAGDPGARTAPTPYTVLASNGMTLTAASSGSVPSGLPADDAAAQLRFKGIRIQVEYYVIDRTKSRVAIRYTVDATGDNAITAEGGDRPQIPDLIKSPLAYNFKYYSQADISGTDAYATYTVKGDELTAFGYTSQNVYITYDYDNADSPLDLNGRVKYNISLGSNFMGQPDTTNDKWAGVSNYKLTGNTDTDKQQLSNREYLWKLTGSDPYHVEIWNQTDKPRTSDPKGTKLHSRNNLVRNSNSSNFLWYSDAYPILQDANDNTAFVILSGSQPKEDGYALVYSYSSTNSGYHANKIYDDFRDDGAGYAFIDYNDGSWTEATRSDINNPGIYKKDKWVTPFSSKAFTTLTFTPNQTVPVVYHLTKKITGVELQRRDPSVPVRSALELPDNWERKYCDYTYTYYYIEDGYKSQDGELYDVPVSKADYEAHHDADARYRQATTTIVPMVYVETDPDTQEPLGQLDLYIDYSVRPHIKEGTMDEVDPDGLPFNLMAWDAATMNQLMANMNDETFNLTTYEKRIEQLTGTMGLPLRRCDYLYFMVMATNDDFSRGQQYFLQRQENGRIAWLNNGYQPHAAQSQNINGWDYSRCAEAYRPDDHTPFQEKTWLWAFAGDPYDLYVYNISAVVEEQYNFVTEVSSYQMHKDHVTSYTALGSGSQAELAVTTPGYADRSPRAYQWGLAPGAGAASSHTFSIVTSQNSGTTFTPTLGDDDDEPLYWTMAPSRTDKVTELMLKPRTAAYSGLDFNLRVLPYEPKKYEDVRLVIRRTDVIGTTADPKDRGTYLGNYPVRVADSISQHLITGADIPIRQQAATRFIDNLPTGTVRMYTADNERRFVAGDVIRADDPEALPFDVRRTFCSYTFYEDDFRTAGHYTVKFGAQRGDVLRYEADVTVGGKVLHKKGDIIFNSVGMPMYNYYAVDPETGAPVYVQIGTDPETGNPIYATDDQGNKIRQGAAPQTAYIAYQVTSDLFLAKAPTKAEVQAMEDNNDHVFFMDFTDNLSTQGYNYGQHAYYDKTSTFRDQITTRIKAEKRVWNGSEFVDDNQQWYNFCQFKTTRNRMESVPQNLKWYFVGDPYSVRVFCTDDDFNTGPVTVDGTTYSEPGLVGANLARFDPTESNYQFVVDCVHLRIPTDEVTDQRTELSYHDQLTNQVLGTIANPNYGKAYYQPFYWEMVPAYSDTPDAFALRFRADNPVRGLRNVYYYLSHDGKKREYEESTESQRKQYFVNLSYDVENAKWESSKYIGYHRANDQDCVIRLVQPAKVYVSAYKGDSYVEDNRVTREELTEYFGVGETLREVPRHLQRKFVSYSDWEYEEGGYPDNNSEYGGSTKGTWRPYTPGTDPLDATRAYSLLKCDAHADGQQADALTTHRITTDEAAWQKALKRASFKFRVRYRLDADGQRLFTTGEDRKWLDVKVGNSGNSGWLYYDKTRTTADGAENQKERVGNYAYNSAIQKSAWLTGLKGLHWAFEGDPYDFTIVNRRRSDDALEGNTEPMYLALTKHTIADYAGTAPADSVIWTTSLVAATDDFNTVEETGSQPDDTEQTTHFALSMWKVGGTADYFLRTASLKQSLPSDTGVEQDLVGDYGNTSPQNQTNRYWRLVAKDYPAGGGATSFFEAVPFSLDAKSTYSGNTADANYSKTMAGLGVTQQRADIRTVIAPDNDGADNDCFDANVYVYDTQGNRKAYLEHVEVRYGDVFESMPYTLRRYGCSYIRCYLNGLPGSSLPAPTAAPQLIADANNGISAQFSDDLLAQATPVTDGHGRRYVNIAYVYTVSDDVAPFFTTADDQAQEEYTWINAYYKWYERVNGAGRRIITYEDVFDHYVYSSDGHIIDEVYKKVEKVTYSTGTANWEYNGWVNTHDGQQQAYGNITSQSDADELKWAFIGDPYSFEMKNYAQFLDNDKTGLAYSAAGGIQSTTVTADHAHWALVVGGVATDKDGRTVTDDKGNTVYNYYLALIDDEDGTVRQYVTFDRSRNGTELAAADQYLKLGGSVPADPTGNSYDVAGVKPFLLDDLANYANIVVYHLVIAHQHSRDPEDKAELDDARHYALNVWTGDIANNRYDATARYSVMDHLAEWDWYNNHVSGKDDKGGYPLSDAEVTALGDKYVRPSSLRDVISDPIADYSVQRVGIGNRLSVPWYMRRQFCNYKLYQRDVMRSVTLNGENGTEKVPDYYQNDEGLYTDAQGNVLADQSQPVQRTFVENGVVKPAYKIKWVSVTADPTASNYSTVVGQNGKQVSRLDASHRNRMVIVDVVYSVKPEEFRFADQGRNTTAWYSMMTNNAKDGLMNFSYKDGIGARHGREEHYTNNYLWAPEGDPYGYILHSRYATVNGTGWDNIVVTSPSKLPETDTETTLGTIGFQTTYTDGETLTAKDVEQLSYTGQFDKVNFRTKRITHPGRNADRRTWAARNAVYEMFEGDPTRSYSFLMHPTGAYVNTDGGRFSSYYVIHNTTQGHPDYHKAELRYVSDVAAIRANDDANWRLFTTPEQLLPYFERAGYVGGLRPQVAAAFRNQQLYSQLLQYKATYQNDPSVIDFGIIDQARELVYKGKFYRRGSDNKYTTELTYNEPRPTDDPDKSGDANYDADAFPLKFVADNLVPLTQGYYRIQAFSRKALDADGANLDGTGTKGIVGPRYISGYRHRSEMDYEGYSNGSLHEGSRWLHFVETDAAHATVRTWGGLNAIIRNLDATSHYERDIEPHPAMRGNIDILPADFDPASIFYFTPADMTGDAADPYDRWNISTQGLRLRGRAGGVQGIDYEYHTAGNDPNFGMTKLVDPDATGYAPGPGTLSGETGTFDDRFRINDIGGTAFTMRLRKYDKGETGPDGTTLNSWDQAVAENLKTNYLCIDANHRYRITIHTDNELKEIGDSYSEGDDYWQISNINYGIQDTKWLLQPVGTRTDWPYNQMPLRLAVNAGGQKPDPATGKGLEGTDNKDPYYYASLYVPFDTRLASTVDVAFTSTKDSPAPPTLTLQAVSQLNNMGNPQFIPAGWPVIIRASKPKTTIANNDDGTTVSVGPYVELNLPNARPTAIPTAQARLRLYGEYLEQQLTDDAIDTKTGKSSWEKGRDVMVFGLPFSENGDKATYGEAGTDRSYDYYDYDTDDAVGFYTNENWWAGHYATSQVTDSENSGLLQHAFLATARNATAQQRDNKYVRHNRVYLVYDYDPDDDGSGAAPGRHITVLFGDEDRQPDDRPIDDTVESAAPWPCDVYDLTGRRVAEQETPATLRRNNPALRPGVYIFGKRKVVVK